GAVSAVPESGIMRFAGPYQTVRFSLHAPPPGPNGSWALVVLDRRRSAVWTAEGSGAVPTTIEWNGVTAEGDPARPGAYECQLVVRGAGTYQRLSVPAPFRLERAPEAARGPGTEEPGGF
ncbi:MAG: hypothetical protein AAB368_05180, partial [bacterium]